MLDDEEWWKKYEWIVLMQKKNEKKTDGYQFDNDLKKKKLKKHQLIIGLTYEKITYTHMLDP